MSKDVQRSADRANPGRAVESENQTLSILRLPAVITRVGLSRSSIYARVRRGTFPHPVRLGPHSMGFVEHEINSWLRAAIERRNAQ